MIAVDGAASPSAAKPVPAGPSRPPNIVFIMADDLGYADLGCYGRRDLSTPNIDQIAKKGIRLLQAYANSAVCSATRLALITGRYQYRLPLGLEEPLAGKPDVGLPPEHPTLPSLLRQVGYQTSLVGKWHLGMPPDFGPSRSGYDRFFGIRSGAVDYYSHENPRRQHDLWDGDVPVRRRGYLTDILGDQAVDAVNVHAASGRPFLLSLHFTAPHWPWEAPGDAAESERLRGTDLRHFDGGTQRTYIRMIQAMDLQIGRVLQALDANGLSDDTIVIFTSDNGGERFSDTWPFTGVKTELLEGGLRIPVVICWPTRIPAGQVSDQVTITMDWFQTLLAAAGIVPHADYPADGLDLLPILTKQHEPVRRTLFWRYKSNAQRAVRDGDFKYLKIQDNTFLFNVVDDPRERANLRERRKDLFDRMVSDWHAWNATMLPEIADSFAETYTAAQLADHIGLR
ncbi:sulfatase family protein [Rhodopila sp.]|uniref:sulfatase family protein n=1 Tax=Rhodopila sp. TaxID=2480087 RepID=UPI003D0B0628